MNYVRMFIKKYAYRIAMAVIYSLKFEISVQGMLNFRPGCVRGGTHPPPRLQLDPPLTLAKVDQNCMVAKLQDCKITV